MLPNGTTNHNAHVNGNGQIVGAHSHIIGAHGHASSNAQGTYMLECESDYPAVDLTPWQAPKPAPHSGQADAVPLTLNMSWMTDDTQYSATARGTVDEVFAIMRAVQTMRKVSKERAAKAKEGRPTVPEPDSYVPPCKIHGTPMIRRISKRTRGTYFFHDLPGGNRCFGRG